MCFLISWSMDINDVSIYSKKLFKSKQTRKSKHGLRCLDSFYCFSQIITVQFRFQYYSSKLNLSQSLYNIIILWTFLAPPYASFCQSIPRNRSGKTLQRHKKIHIFTTHPNKGFTRCDRQNTRYLFQCRIFILSRFAQDRTGNVVY